MITLNLFCIIIANITATTREHIMTNVIKTNSTDIKPAKGKQLQLHLKNGNRCFGMYKEQFPQAMQPIWLGPTMNIIDESEIIGWKYAQHTVRYSYADQKSQILHTEANITADSFEDAKNVLKNIASSLGIQMLKFEGQTNQENHGYEQSHC